MSNTKEKLIAISRWLFANQNEQDQSARNVCIEIEMPFREQNLSLTNKSAQFVKTFRATHETASISNCWFHFDQIR